MILRSCLLLLLICCLTIAGSAQTESGEEKAGHEVFDARCTSCHGITGKGGDFGPNLIDRLPLLKDEGLIRILHEGVTKKGMPAFPDLQSKERDNLIRFLRFLQKSGTKDDK